MKDKRHIFNASFYTTEKYQAEWRRWLDEIFLPFVDKQVPDSEHEIFEVQSEVNQDMLVFAVQVRCSSSVQLETLQKKSVSVFNNFRARFGERVANFNSVLIKID